jgi:hypothetical protein
MKVYKGVWYHQRDYDYLVSMGCLRIVSNVILGAGLWRLENLQDRLVKIIPILTGRPGCSRIRAVLFQLHMLPGSEGEERAARINNLKMSKVRIAERGEDPKEIITDVFNERRLRQRRRKSKAAPRIPKEVLEKPIL